MLTNLRDAYTGQSRSPNILDIVSYSAIVTSDPDFKVATFLKSNIVKTKVYDIRLQKCRDLEIGVRGHSKSLKVAPFDRLCIIS